MYKCSLFLLLYFLPRFTNCQQSAVQVQQKPQKPQESIETLCNNLNHLRAEYPVTYQILLMHCIDPSHKIPSGYFDNHLKNVKKMKLLTPQDTVLPEVKEIMVKVYQDYAEYYAHKEATTQQKTPCVKSPSVIVSAYMFLYNSLVNWAQAKKN